MDTQSSFSTFLTRSWSRDGAMLLLRLWLGSMMIMHGWGKVFGGVENLTERVTQMGFPLPEFFAWSAAFSEFAGGILLVLGLFTRPASFFVAATMIVAGFIRHFDDPFAKKELALTYLVMAIVILIAGPGKTSLDRLLFGNSHKK